MKIEFTDRVIPTDTGALMFQALVDGKSTVCRVTAEALQQHFGGTDDVTEVQISNMQAFQRGREKINAAAERIIRAGHDFVMVESEDIV